MRRAAPAIAGAIVIVAYVAVAVVSYRAGLLPVRPLYDGGVQLPPYRWVERPADAVGALEAPARRTATVNLEESQTLTVATEDLQAVVVFQKRGVDDKESTFEVEIVPLDPAGIGAAPRGMLFDGNAYRVTATYADSGDPVRFTVDSCPDDQQPVLCATMVLRYARRGTDLVRRDGDRWDVLTSTVAPPSHQVFANTAELGTFAVIGPDAAAEEPSNTSARVLAVLLGVSVLGNALLLRRAGLIHALHRSNSKKIGPPAQI